MIISGQGYGHTENRNLRKPPHGDEAGLSSLGSRCGKKHGRWYLPAAYKGSMGGPRKEGHLLKQKRNFFDALAESTDLRKH